jgi:hypothetical protein
VRLPDRCYCANTSDGGAPAADKPHPSDCICEIYGTAEAASVADTPYGHCSPETMRVHLGHEAAASINPTHRAKPAMWWTSVALVGLPECATRPCRCHLVKSAALDD